MSNKTNISDSF